MATTFTSLMNVTSMLTVNHGAGLDIAAEIERVKCAIETTYPELHQLLSEADAKLHTTMFKHKILKSIVQGLNLSHALVCRIVHGREASAESSVKWNVVRMEALNIITLDASASHDYLKRLKQLVDSHTTTADTTAFSVATIAAEVQAMTLIRLEELGKTIEDEWTRVQKLLPEAGREKAKKSLDEAGINL
ncbi:uncharacterized protein BKA78DRAFT_349421 [Phyllosticta capitalensis]|uniref:uncharacterized protein n=1 Tax=Phyllosticta capitalensis TaxID=121624 RepID=UPI00312D2528